MGAVPSVPQKAGRRRLGFPRPDEISSRNVIIVG